MEKLIQKKAFDLFVDAATEGILSAPIPPAIQADILKSIEEKYKQKTEMELDRIKHSLFTHGK